MHHCVAMSYFPALMRINGPEKQQFYHIYSLERHAVTWLHLLCAQSICCVAGRSCVHISLEAFHEDKGHTLVCSHFQTKCMTGLDILFFRRDVEFISHTRSRLRHVKNLDSSGQRACTTFYWNRQRFLTSSVIFLYHDTVYYHLQHKLYTVLPDCQVTKRRGTNTAW